MPDAAESHRLAHRDELVDGTPQRFSVAGRDLMVVRIGHDVYTLADPCPHNGASLSEGLVRDGCVTCPAHLWRFSLADGRRQGNDAVRVATYVTVIDQDGWIRVTVPPMPPAMSLREALLASARGEDLP